MAIFQSILAGRWAMLLLVLPYALVWGRAMPSGGVLAALGLCAAVLYYFSTVDARLARTSGQLRFAMHRSRGRVDRLTLETARPVFAIAALLIGLALLLLVSFWMGATLMGAVGVIALLDLSPRRYPMRLVEIAIPAGTLVLPLLVARIVSEPVRVQNGIAELTMVGAFMLAALIVLCLVRDEQLDRGEGRATSAVIFGDDGALLLFLLYASSAIGILTIGVAQQYWGWPVAAVLPAAAMAALWLATMRATSLAVTLWFVAGAVVAIALNIGTIGTLG